MISLLAGGPIYTISHLGVVEALAWEDGTIVAVGRDAVELTNEAKTRGLEVEHLDLNGRFAMPGFVDAHCHLSLGALGRLGPDISKFETVAEVKTLISALANTRSQSRWLRITGYDPRVLDRPLSREDLDDAAGDLPAICTHYSLHEGVINSAGLLTLGWDAEISDPKGGVIERDPCGTPTGRLIERAHAVADAIAIKDLCGEEDWAQLMTVEAEFLLRQGITCLHDAAVGPRAMSAYRQLANSKDLIPTVVAMPHADTLMTAPESGWLTELEGTEVLRIGSVKVFADGGTHPCTMKPGQAGGVERGVCLTDPSQLSVALKNHDRMGFATAIHVMGNRGLATVLEGIERAQLENPVRLEHVTCAEPAQVKRMAALEVTASIQPGFVEVMGDSVGRWQHAKWLGFADYLSAGVSLAAGSDHPCSEVAPLKAISHGITRRTRLGNILDADQAIPLDFWLEAYTLGAARAAGLDGELGSLVPGKRADVIALSKDPRSVIPESLDAVSVEEVWLNGRSVTTC